MRGASYVLAGPDQHEAIGVAEHLHGGDHRVDILLARRAPREHQKPGIRRESQMFQ